jgi:HlyD family secretion protein
VADPSAPSQVDALLGARPRNRTRRRLGIGLLLLALAAAATLLLRFMEGNTTPYYMLPLARGDLHPRLTLDGTVRLPGEIAVSAPWDGVIATAPAAIGAVVERGQPLATIEDPAIERTIAGDRAQWASTRAEQARAAVATRDSAARLARFEAVWRESQHRVPSLDEMEHARADAARAAIAARRARLLHDAAWQRLRADLARRGRIELPAPAAGVVAMRAVEAGSWVHAGQTVVELAPRGAAPQVVVPLPVAIGPLTPGAAARVELHGAGKTARDATLLRVDTDAVGRRLAIFALAPGAFVSPGAGALVEMTLPVRRHVLLLPDAALAFAHPCSAPRSRSSIWLWTSDGAAHQVDIVVGAGDGRHSEIVAGKVKSGDLAIIGWKTPPRSGWMPPASSQPSRP